MPETNPTFAAAARSATVLVAVALVGCSADNNPRAAAQSGAQDSGAHQNAQREVILSLLDRSDPDLVRVRVTPTSDDFYELARLLERHRVFLYLVEPEFRCGGGYPTLPPAMLHQEHSAGRLLGAMTDGHDAQVVQVKNGVGVHCLFYRAAPDEEIERFRDAMAGDDAERRDELLRAARFTHDLRIVGIVQRYLHSQDKGTVARSVLLGNVGVLPAALLLHEPDAFALVEDAWNRGHHVQAAAALGRIGGARAVERLRSMLGDADPDLRLASVQALRFVPATAAVQTLETAVTDKSAAVREAVAEAFSWSTDTRALAALSKLAKDDEPAVRRGSASALGWHGPAALDSLGECFKDASPEVRRAATVSLEKVPGRDAAGLLAGALRDTDYLVRESAAASLAAIGERFSIAVLTEAARAEAHDTRWAAVGALGRIRTETSFALLKERIDDPEISVQARAVYAMGAFGEPSALPVLKDAVERHACCHVQSAAATALGEIRGEAAVSMLAELYDKNMRLDYWHVRRTIAHALGTIGTDSAIGQLKRILDVENPGADAGDREVQLVLSIRRGAIYALGGSGHAGAVPMLERELRHADRQVRRDAIGALARFGGPAATDALLEHEFHRPEDREVLHQALRDWLIDDPKVRKRLGFES